MYGENGEQRFMEFFDSLAQDYILTNAEDPRYKNVFDALQRANTYTDGFERDFQDAGWDEEAAMASIQPDERPLRPRQPQQPIQQGQPGQPQGAQTRVQPPRPQPMPQPMPQPPAQRRRPSFPLPPPGPRAVRLAADIYRQVRALENTYEQLARIAPRNQVDQIQRMQRETRLLAIPALNIYIALSGNVALGLSRPPSSDLPNNYCAALRITFNRASNLNDDIVALQRLVNIPSIDRQLIIMGSVLQRQLTTMNRMLIDCYTR